MNRSLIKSHAKLAYMYVAHGVKVDIDFFYVDVKTNSGYAKTGPFTVVG
ncbi:MAG TPA: hypothetical protein VG815_14190 [Chloroflexota bacterium]|jgi:hypothetical protein|nr:hypothetical protein [Chloroflexota bacterium]